jgi:polysaccharide export outer membrane protein
MNRKSLKFVLALLACCLCGVALGSEPYRLGSNDVVRVTVFGQPDLSTVARVAENGSISFPFIGEVSVGGLTTREAEVRIGNALRAKSVVKEPQVGVMVDSFQSRRVAVLGEVKNPGIYVISRGSTVMDMISEAGGLTTNAGNTAVITSKGSASANRSVDLSAILTGRGSVPTDTVKDGDTVFVSRMEQFYVYGQVNRPGAYPLESGMTVMQALSVAGGLTDKGTERGMKVRRTNETGSVETISVGPTNALKPSDVLFVKESLF